MQIWFLILNQIVQLVQNRHLMFIRNVRLIFSVERIQVQFNYLIIFLANLNLFKMYLSNSRIEFENRTRQSNLISSGYESSIRPITSNQLRQPLNHCSSQPNCLMRQLPRPPREHLNYQNKVHSHVARFPASLSSQQVNVMPALKIDNRLEKGKTQIMDDDNKRGLFRMKGSPLDLLVAIPKRLFNRNKQMNKNLF